MKALAKALALFSSASLVGTAVQLVKGKLGAVILGASGVGILSQLTYLWSLFHIFAGLGFYNGLVRRVAECHGKGDMPGVRKQLTTTVIVLTFFSVAASMVGWVFSDQMSHLLLNDHGKNSILVALILTGLPLAVNARIYRGLLSGVRAVKSVVEAQIIADVLSLFTFILLVFLFDLTGAVIAFVLLHVFKLVFYLNQASKVFHSDLGSIQVSQFCWTEVRHNLGYGLNGLLMVSVGIITILTLSRWIIDQYGTASNGVFSVAWKVATVYLGALYASAGSYYFPVLSACENNQELTKQVNDAISLYMYIVPPIAAGLMLGGEFLVEMLFSKEFSYAAVILLLLLPGDIFRISAETMGLTFLAKKKLMIYTGLYLVWAFIFLTMAWYWLPVYGLVGAAMSYAVSHVVNSVLVFVLARRIFSFRLSVHTSLAVLRGLGLVFTVAMVRVYQSSPLLVMIIGVLLLIIWFLSSLNDKEFMKLFLAAKKRILRFG